MVNKARGTGQNYQPHSSPSRIGSRDQEAGAGSERPITGGVQERLQPHVIAWKGFRCKQGVHFPATSRLTLLHPGYVNGHFREDSAVPTSIPGVQ